MTAALRIRDLLAAVALAGSAAMASAQTLPPAGDNDLLVPPDLRAGPQAAPAKAPTPVRGRTAARSGVAPQQGSSAALARRHAQPEHPVDVGVVMRGGSATPRVYSPTGSTQAAQESGSAFGAGMRIGF